MTDAYVERQRTRSEGRYSAMNRCESCGKALGANYYSAPDCNETGWGVVLCRSCATAIAQHHSAGVAGRSISSQGGRDV